MREVIKRQAELGALAIGAIFLDPKSRDDIRERNARAKSAVPDPQQRAA